MTGKKRRQRAYKQALRFRRKGLTIKDIENKAKSMMHKWKKSNNNQRCRRYANRIWLLGYAQFIMEQS